MLHDLYLLSCYFNPDQAVLYEEEVKNRYGLEVFERALKAGWIVRLCPPCFSKSPRFYIRLSEQGREEAQRAMI